MKKKICIYLLLTAIFYIGGSVISQSLNPFAWEKDSRQVVAGVWIGVMILATAFLFIDIDTLNNE